MVQPDAQVGLLGLGSNVGERRANLQSAVAALSAAGIEVLASSSTYDTDPVGDVLEQPSFLNACLLVRTALEPLELLDAVKRMELELGRDRFPVRHGPRKIDMTSCCWGSSISGTSGCRCRTPSCSAAASF